MDTDPALKDKVQWLFKLSICGLDYRVQNCSYIQQ